VTKLKVTGVAVAGLSFDTLCARAEKVN